MLGTLRGRARARFERLLASDASLNGLVDQWENALMPLADGIAPVNPSPEIWLRLQTRLGQGVAALPVRKPAPSAWWQSMNFWRGWGIASSAIAAGLLVYFSFISPQAPQETATTHIAVLSNEQAQPIISVSARRKSRQLFVKVLSKQTIAADRTFELWMLPTGGAPRSLGLLAADGTSTLSLPSDTDSLESIPALAVSLEPIGGSTTGAPTGPVLFKGAVITM